MLQQLLLQGEPLADWEKEILDAPTATAVADAPTTPEA
jgi:hypothetical protein